MRRQRNPTVSPDDAAALWREPESVRGAAVTAKCELITPMYGGGVEAGQVDRGMPIRASALRGQLRFWWRLLYGGGRASKDVFADECALWGGIAAEGAQASQVTVRVDCEPVNDSHLIDATSNQVPNYGLIIDRDGPTPRLLKQGYPFGVTLEVHREEKMSQVVGALRWWASIHGVGARTRRGFGAVKMECAGIEPVQAGEVETFGGRMVTGGQGSQDALAAWHSAIAAFGTFRQGPRIGRGQGSGGSNRPGRSNWPEPDTIRRVAGKWAGHHNPQHPVDGVYPRAAFGLPIVFHFKDRGDPNDQLEAAGEGRDRMASPLILRPYFDGKAYRPMALLLPGWEQRIGVDVALRSKRANGKSVKAWPADVDERKRLADQIEPMRGRGADVLSAFMHYFAERTGTKRGRR